LNAVKTVYLIILIMGAIIALQEGKKWITASTYFQVTTLEITGNGDINPEEVKKLVHIDAKQNIFALNTEAVRRKVLTHPRVKEITVKRKLPRTITIAVVERKALAVLEGAPRALLDEEGVVLELRSNSALTGLPHIAGGEGVEIMPGQYITGEKTLRALKIVKAVSSLPFVPEGELYKVNTESAGLETIQLRGYKAPIVIGTDSISDKLKRLYAIADHIYPQMDTIRYIDLTFQDKVVVKYRQKGGARRW
jgi:cell division protein FtsQ